MNNININYPLVCCLAFPGLESHGNACATTLNILNAGSQDTLTMEIRNIYL